MNAYSIKALLDSGETLLVGTGVDSPRAASEWLLSGLLQCRRLELCVRHAEHVTPEIVAQFQAGLTRLAAGEPLQYVIGKEQFFGRDFKTDRRALIPRPETETLVETVLGLREVWDKPCPVVADIGTGAGIIAITLALEQPRAAISAIDFSRDALSLAAENAALLGVTDRIAFIESDMLAAFGPQTLDLVVSNPPYVRSADMASLPPLIRLHEPLSALDGGPDGLGKIRELIRQSRLALRPGGWIAIEIGLGQHENTAELMARAGFGVVKFVPDLAGISRVALGVRTP